MRVLGAAIACVVVVLLCSGSADGRPSSCAPRGSDALAHAGAARAYRDENLRVYACRPGIPPRYLGIFDDPDLLSACNGTLVDLVSVTPRYVAWSTNTMCHNDPPRWTVHVRRLSASATTRTYLAGDACCGARRGVGPVKRLALNARGGLAWSAVDATSSLVHPVFEVAEVVGRRTRRLARGADLDPRSVAWVGARVRWKQAGRVRSG